MPIFESDEEAARIYTVCGKIALNWGPVESAIESLIILLRSRQRAPQDLDFPHSFKNKTCEVKRRLKSDPRLQLHCDSIGSLISDAKHLHFLRTIVVHSICQGSNLEGRIVFGKSDQKRDVSYTDTTLSYRELDDAARKMTETESALVAAFNQLRSDISG